MKQFEEEYDAFASKREIFTIDGHVRTMMEGPRLERMFKAFPDNFKYDISKPLRQLFGPCSFEVPSHWREYVWRIALDGSHILWVCSGRLGTSFLTNEKGESPCAVKRAVEIIRSIEVPSQTSGNN